jgi:hypothetical protein
VEAQTSAQLRAAVADVLANMTPVIDLDDAFAMQVRHSTIESALGAAYAAGAYAA